MLYYWSGSEDTHRIPDFHAENRGNSQSSISPRDAGTLEIPFVEDALLLIWSWKRMYRISDFHEKIKGNRWSYISPRDASCVEMPFSKDAIVLVCT